MYVCVSIFLDYSVAYYISVAILTFTLFLMIWKINGKREKKPHTAKDSENVDFKALKSLLTIPMGVFLVGIATTGLIYGVHETFLYLYLQKELDASSQLISYMINIASASQALFLPFADKAVKFLGKWFLK